MSYTCLRVHKSCGLVLPSRLRRRRPGSLLQDIGDTCAGLIAVQALLALASACPALPTVAPSHGPSCQSSNLHDAFRTASSGLQYRWFRGCCPLSGIWESAPPRGGSWTSLQASMSVPMPWPLATQRGRRLLGFFLACLFIACVVSLRLRTVTDISCD